MPACAECWESREQGCQLPWTQSWGELSQDPASVLSMCASVLKSAGCAMGLSPAERRHSPTLSSWPAISGGTLHWPHKVVSSQRALPWGQGCLSPFNSEAITPCIHLLHGYQAHATREAPGWFQWWTWVGISFLWDRILPKSPVLHRLCGEASCPSSSPILWGDEVQIQERWQFYKKSMTMGKNSALSCSGRKGERCTGTCKGRIAG